MMKGLLRAIVAVAAVFLSLPFLQADANADDPPIFWTNIEATNDNETNVKAMETKLERVLVKSDCWGAIGFFAGSETACIFTDQTNKRTARRTVLKMTLYGTRCVKKSIRTFSNGCAAMVWSSDKQEKNKAFGFAIDTDGYQKAMDKARNRCVKRSKRKTRCPHEEYVCSTCPRPVVGRPFVDSEKNTLQADAVFETEDSWNTLEPLPIETNICHKNHSLSEGVANHNAEVGSVWLKKGLEEHASIASFAAFTLQLMANGAPSELIRDSLLAGLDEVNHAISSFEVASLFTGRHAGPSALPPSSHTFKRDMASLAQSTAIEGCVDETLSAFVAAAEVDALDRDSSTDEKSRLLRERLAVIALDEAKHASLAWRTIRWVCSKDEFACNAVLNRVLNPENLLYESKRREHWAEVDGAFATVYKALLPQLTFSVKKVKEEKESAICHPNPTEKTFESKSFTDELALEIIRGVLCLE